MQQVYEELLGMKELQVNRVIVKEREFAYAYNNRGLSKIKLGQLAEGFNDILASFA